ncbi:hypothetical protein BFJ72_g14758 [Fusarium proliferatum]|uniref:PNPLA domain-containing protein n=1 Tax=Gibberella intermedia TaxID=948311 RepID=A0A420RYP8_GIBIN|nr:hypothetical protein BFJ72_g14758 [Fusarium proliferatum]
MSTRKTNARPTADNRWMTVSEQSGSLSIQLTPLLAERLDATEHTNGMALLIGSPSCSELSDHLRATSSDGNILLAVDTRTKVLRVACPTLARHVGTEDHCPGDNIGWARAKDGNTSQSLAAIYSRLLGPFTNVVCIFASSFTSTTELGTFLSTWLRSAWSRTQVPNSPSASEQSMPHDFLVALPRLIVLTEEKSSPGSGFLESLKASLEATVFEQTGFFLNRAFSSLTVKDTATEACILRQRRYTKVTAFLDSECAVARRTFERLNMLYHTHTMVDLFSRAYHCLLNNEAFDPVAASRTWSPVPPNAAQQIVRFLSEHKDEETLRTFALPYLVSAIRANAYPAEAHQAGCVKKVLKGKKEEEAVKRLIVEISGICALTLAHKGISVKKAIQDFTDLSQRVFVSQPIWARAFNLIARGSIYDSSAIDEALKRHYGESKLSDYTPATARAAKVLVTVKGTPKGDQILSNFNGVGLDDSRKDFEQAFRHPNDEEGQEAILAWQAARSTSAAPVIFPTFTIDGVGTFQDGAMWRNNPADVALSLAPALMQGHCLPDILLSIGTGFEKVPQRSHRERQPPARSTIPVIDLLRRLCAFMGDNIATDGEKFHNHIMAGRSDVGSWFRRLNVPLSEGCPSIDDASSIPRLMDEAAAHFKSNPSMQEVMDSIISSFFYFELSSRPLRHRTHVSFCGRILCDIQPGHRLKHFIKHLRIRGAEFSINGNFTALDSVGEWNGREVDFEIPVRGTVAGLHTRLEIFLCWNMNGQKIKKIISRSPFSLDGIMEAQGWDSPQSRALRQLTKSGRKRGLDCHAAWKRIKKARS